MSLIELPGSALPMPEWVPDLGVFQTSTTGRSWWAVRYVNGTIINEWDDDPGSPNGHADWSRIPYAGRQAVRLYCPSGQVAHLGDTVDATGRLVQFKLGLRTIGYGDHVLAHVIGIVEETDGQGRFYAWELQPDGSGYLTTFIDNVYEMQYHAIGQLSSDHLGLVPA